MNIYFGLYLVGYFISFGLAFGFKEEKDSWWDIFGFACFLGLLSWINIGILLGDICNIYVRDKKDSAIINQNNKK